MAGSGRRVFAPGEVLTASNTMNYLMDQAVMNFAGTAARGSAIGSAVSEGMVSYLADTNSVEVYDSSSWRSLNPAGRVVQTIFSTTSTRVETSSNVDTGLEASITPIYPNSDIYVTVHQMGLQRSAVSSVQTINVRLYKNGSLHHIFGSDIFYTATIQLFQGTMSGAYKETVSSTSTITYKTNIAANITGSTVAAQQNSNTSIMIIQEIAR